MTNVLDLCPACGKTHLQKKVEWDEVEYKGKHGRIRYHITECQSCGSRLAGPRELLDNKRAWVRFRKEIDRIPSGGEIAKTRKFYGLSQALAGELFGGGPVAFSKYENDDLVPDEAMANLLYLAARYPDAIFQLAARKGIPLARNNNRGISNTYFEVELSAFSQVGTEEPGESVVITTADYAGPDRRKADKKSWSESYRGPTNEENEWAPQLN